MTDTDPQPLLATKVNMVAAEEAGIIGVTAYSPETDERYSADPADYWDRPDGWVMAGDDGMPLILVRFVTVVEDVQLP